MTFKQFSDYLIMILITVVVILCIGATFYACEVIPMEECMGQGHSFAYCYKLLNKR
jgi:hypothetical protein